MLPQNVLRPMTRRYPDISPKALARDAKIVGKVVRAGEARDFGAVFAIFTKEQKNLSHERYWELLRTVWIICGSVETAPWFINAMKSTRPQRHYFSTPEDAEELRKMPDKFFIYRATNDVNDGGIAWTHNEEYAKKYKELFQKKYIMKYEVKREDVFALISRNGEDEIILLPVTMMFMQG